MYHNIVGQCKDFINGHCSSNGTLKFFIKPPHLFSSSPKGMEGAVAIVSAKDIPQNGKNDFMLGLAGEPEAVQLHTDMCVSSLVYILLGVCY